jgi:hypothetical protein
MTPILTLVPCTALGDRDLHVLHAFDRARRLQTRALLDALRAAPADDVGVAEELREWTARTAAAIGRHHRVLDEVVTPCLVAADPLAAPLAGAMRAGHALVADLLDALEDALSGWVGMATFGSPADDEHRRATEAAERVVVAVDDQVAREQAMLEPAIVCSVPPADWDEVHGELLVLADPAELPFLFPWVVRGSDPVEEERIVTQLPRMLRVVHRFVWTPSHARSYPHVTGAAGPVEASFEARSAS